MRRRFNCGLILFEQHARAPLLLPATRNATESQPPGHPPINHLRYQIRSKC
jgi:hypothetical protein